MVGIRAAASRLLLLLRQGVGVEGGRGRGLRRRRRRRREQKETASRPRQLFGSHGLMKSWRMFAPPQPLADRARCDARDALKFS